MKNTKRFKEEEEKVDDQEEDLRYTNKIFF